MILGATGATLVASLLQMALPVLSGWLISAISTDKGYSQECKQSAAALDRCRRERLQQVVALMGISFLVAGITLALGLWLYMLSGERLVARLRCRLFAAYVHQDIAFYDAQKTGDLMNRLASDCTELKTTLTRSLGEGMSNTMQLGVGISLMLISSPILTLVTLGAAPIIALCGLIYGLFVAKLSERYQKALVRSSATPASTLSTLSSHPNTYTLQAPQHVHSPANPAPMLSTHPNAGLSLARTLTELTLASRVRQADASDVAQQALSSIRTVRSFANEEYERHRCAPAGLDPSISGLLLSLCLLPSACSHPKVGGCVLT